MTSHIHYFDIEQRSEAWFKLRENIFITGSNVNEILRPRESKTYEKLVWDKAYRIPKNFSNEATEHGIKYEPKALELFSQLYGLKVKQTGFVINDHHPFMGISPDGLIGDSSLLEIKCPYSRKIIQGRVPPSYYHQIQLQLLITERIQCYYFEAKFDGVKLLETNMVIIRKSERWFNDNQHKLHQFIKDVKAQRNHCILTDMRLLGFKNEEFPADEHQPYDLVVF